MTQEARQAIIELLFLSLYMDNHLSLAEDDVLNDALESLGWESDLPRERFIFSAFASARNAFSDPEQGLTFFDSRAEIIKRDGAEADGLTWLSKVLAADGLTASEKRFLARLETTLYPR